MTWPLDEFRLRWTDAAHEFEDKSLEEHRRALVKSAGELIIQIGRLTWDIGGGRQSVKGATDVGEPPEAWEQRGDTLDALAEVVVKAHQDLERAARRWEGRRPVREVILAAMAIAILALPSFGLWRAERLRSQALRDSLAVVSRERDSLWKEVELLRSSEAASAAEATNDQVKSQIADLGKFVREGDEIKRKCLNGPYRPIDDESNWEQKVRGYLRRELGEAYAIRFEQAVVGSGLGFEGVPVAMSDLWFRVDGRQKCLATFVGELQAKQDGR